VDKHLKLVTTCKISTLAVKQSKASYFGPGIMALCTVQGTGTYLALAKTEFNELRDFLHELCYPRLTGKRIEFKNLCKACIEASGTGLQNS